MRIVLDKVYPTSFTPANKNSAVWNTTLTFEPGGHYLIQAPSGTGKSTLAGILYGYRYDFSGGVSIDGNDINQLSAGDWALLRQKKLSVVFQDLRLFNQLSVDENLKIKTRLNKGLNNSLIEEYAATLGIESLLNQKAGTLSFGQKQRVAILRALLQPFEVLLMDEPFSHLDPENTSAAFSLVKKVCGQNKAGFILTSLHDTYNYTYHTILAL